MKLVKPKTSLECGNVENGGKVKKQEENKSNAVKILARKSIFVKCEENLCNGNEMG